MAFIGVDRSGQLESPYVMLATRIKEDKQLADDAIRFNESDLFKYSKIIKGRKNLRITNLKIAAVITFLVVKPPFFKKDDIIHIDQDYNATDREIFINFLRRLWDKYYFGRSHFRSPEIEFHTKEVSQYVKRADRKSKQARRGRLETRDCPNLTKFLEIID